MTPQERRVLDAIDQELLLALLRDLVAIESLGGQETPAQAFMAQQMRTFGFDVETWNLDLERLRRHPAYTVEIERDEALGVVGRLGSGVGPVLVLNGHVDVVPAGEAARWSYPPFVATEVDGRVYGRGAADMKGALCCALVAMRAIQEAGVTLRGTALLQSVVGEEDGGLGTLAAIEHGVVGDAAIVMEPTELMVAPAQAGALNVRVTVPGRAAHGALRAEGVDPIDKFIPLYRALQKFERERNTAVTDPLFADYEVPFALCIGTMRAGIWASTVAETLVFEGRVGMGPHEDADQVRHAFGEAIQTAAKEDLWLRDHPPSVEWWGAQFLPARTPPDAPIVTTVQDAYRDATGAEPVVRGMTYGADMRLLVHQGRMPTLLFGPGDIRVAHAPDEFVPIDDLLIATQVLALTILRCCGSMS